jgi:hypothetical protein
MPHDDTPLDIWYHDVVNDIGIMNGFVCLAIHDLEDRGLGQSEPAIMLRKAMSKYPKVKTALYSDYLERKRLQNGQD